MTFPRLCKIYAKFQSSVFIFHYLAHRVLLLFVVNKYKKQYAHKWTTRESVQSVTFQGGGLNAPAETGVVVCGSIDADELLASPATAAPPPRYSHSSALSLPFSLSLALIAITVNTLSHASRQHPSLRTLCEPLLPSIATPALLGQAPLLIYALGSPESSHTTSPKAHTVHAKPASPSLKSIQILGFSFTRINKTRNKITKAQKEQKETDLNCFFFFFRKITLSLYIIIIIIIIIMLGHRG